MKSKNTKKKESKALKWSPPLIIVRNIIKQISKINPLFF